ncbi:MAG TPA: hypothetical protein VHM90_18740 [Phycisphaerae bacterium]|nr:hypothetical protein [Phycisphaerae bacterium]
MIFTTAILHTARDRQQKVRRFVFAAFVDALLTWLALHALAFYTLRHLATGETYTFTPRGIGLLIDAAIHIGALTVFFLFYTLPSFWVRRWLGWILRALMFGLFGVFLTFMVLIKVIAIVETPDHKIIFYRPFPLPARMYDSPPNAECRRTSAVVSISFLTGVADDLVLYPVYLQDAAGQAEIERLKRRINIVRTTTE